MNNNEKLEKQIQDLKLEAPRVTLDRVNSIITNVEYKTVVTKSGTKFMYCYITLKNGFTVTGNPSVCVSAANFNESVGKQVSYENAFKNIWGLEAYALKNELMEQESHA